MSKRRVVITGLGVISPLGLSVETVWSALLAGQSGIGTIHEFDTSDLSTRFAGLVPNFDVSEYMSIKEARKCDLFIQYGIAAAMQAARDAHIEADLGGALDPDKVGVIIGSGIGGLGTIENTQTQLQAQGAKRVSPFFIPASIVNMISGHVSIRYGLRGPNLAVATACTTGTHAIGLAARAIAYGDADMMLAGGAEKASTPLGLAGFAAARALSSRNESPQQASRPWDIARDGFVLGDGAAVLVLEEYELACQRGRPILAELKGFGMSADAFHITRPSEGGEGAARAMRAALKDAKLSPHHLNYINAHATGTPAGDLEEAFAITDVLGEHASRVAVSSTKSMTGHLLGAAGALEALISVLAIRDQIAPPTINLDNPDPRCVLDLIPHTARPMSIQHVLSNSFGFGGTNGSLVFSRLN